MNVVHYYCSTMTGTRSRGRSLPPKKRKVSPAKPSSNSILTQTARNVILNPMIDSILADEAKSKASGKDKTHSQDYLKQLVDESKVLLPWINTNILKQRLKRRRAKIRAAPEKKEKPTSNLLLTKLPQPHEEEVMEIPSPSQHNDITERKNIAGRPVGSTNVAKKHQLECEAAAVNEIVTLYSIEKEKAKANNKRVEDGWFNETVEKVKRTRNLCATFTLSHATARTRINRGNMLLPVDNHCGPDSPLAAIEPSLISMALQLAKARIPLSSAQALCMINAAITGTDSQQKLIKFKQQTNNQQPTEKYGTVSSNYWRNFLKRHSDVLGVSKCTKFELLRDNFTTYTNFSSMYDNIEHLLVDEAKLATKFETPVSMNEKGERVSESESYGMKIKINITHPDCAITLDEVGGNTSMINDGHCGGVKYVGGKGDKCQQKVSNKVKKFTVLGLTAFSGDPVMCVVIVDGKQRDVFIELGIDDSNLSSTYTTLPTPSFDITAPNSSNFFANIGPGNTFPGGPTCVFRGKEIPTMVRYNEGGGISSTILTDIFKTLDSLEVYDDVRKKGKMPFVLLDGHHSRFGFEFLEYINNEKHPWCFSIGVPYGTALWQVGDSVEQNGCFKMHMGKKKQEIITSRMQNFCVDLGITVFDIIPIINTGWEKSFAKKHSNKKAYYERGWFPFNRNLLLNKQIRSTMTTAELKIEQESGLKQVQQQDDFSSSTSTMSSEYSQRIADRYVAEKIQAAQGTYTGTLLSQLVSMKDLQAARQQNIEKKKMGDAHRDLVSKKRLTASRLVLEHNTHHLGMHVLEEIKRKQTSMLNDEKEKKQKQEQKMQTILNDGDMIRLKHNSQTDNIAKWPAADIRTLLKTYRRKEDKPLPTKKNDLVSLFHQWKTRDITNFNGTTHVDLTVENLVSVESPEILQQAQAQTSLGVEMNDKNEMMKPVVM